MSSKVVDYEEALTMTGWGRFNIMTMMLCGSMIMAMGVETSSVAYLVPASACELKTTSEQQGLMAGMPLVGILVASNIWGYLADTRGRRKTLMVAMMLSFGASSLATFSPNWIVFCILKLLSSAAMAGVFGVSNALLAECTPTKQRFRLIMLNTSVFATSVGLMAATTIPVIPLKFSYHIPVLDIHFNSWRLMNFIFCLPCATGAISTYFACESPKYLLTMKRDEEALEILRNMYVINSGESGSKYKVDAVQLDENNEASISVGFWKSVVSQTVPLFKPPLLGYTLLLAAIFITVYFCVTPFTVWVPYMVNGFMKSLGKGETGLTFCEMLRSSQNVTAVDHVKVDDCTFDSTAMLMVFSMNCLLAIMNLVLSIILPYLGRKTTLVGLQLTVGLAAMMVNSSRIWVLTAILIFIFINGMLNFGVLTTFSVDLYPTYLKAMGVCLTLMIGRGSAVLGINLLKNLLTYNCDATFYVFGSISIVGGLLGLLLPSEKQMRESKQRVEEHLPKPNE